MNTRTSHRSRGRCRPGPAPTPPAPSSTDAFDQLASSLGDVVERIVRSLDPARAAGSIAASAAPMPSAPGVGRHHHDGCCGSCGHGGACGCRCCCEPYEDDHGGGCRSACDCCPPRCGPDPCHCDCCIGDVDIVVYAHVGETRIVPVTLVNTRARERVVDLDLGPFTTKGGRPAPIVARVTPSKVTLGPCSEEEVVVAVRIGQPGTEQVPPAGGKPSVESPKVEARAVSAELTKAELLELADERGVEATSSMTKDEIVTVLVEEERVRAPERELLDVDDCLVAVADLRATGCDHRPIRIAVAVLPRDCASYEASCGCSCC